MEKCDDVSSDFVPAILVERKGDIPIYVGVKDQLYFITPTQWNPRSCLRHPIPKPARFRSKPIMHRFKWLQKRFKTL